MAHHTPLITTVVMGLGLAFLLGLLAQRFRISPLVGYLLAGVLVGPFTPGFVADQALAPELAEIGVILLMFGVGLHFSLEDLLSVRAMALPGAIVQMAVATVLGFVLARGLGWPAAAGVVFGLALSVASTVVLLRAVQERRLVETERGRIAVGWLIVEDLAMVLALVLLPALAGVLAPAEPGAQTGSLLVTLALTLGKVVAFVAFMLIVGKRVIPWLLEYVAGTGSRELFRLAVLAIALGVAFGAARLFGVSFALGAFFAGMILSESELSHQAAEESLPLRDAFAVLFFVSVGMLFDPSTLLRDPIPVLLTVLIIVIGKSVAAFAIVALFRYPVATALTISASLAQIGEFSFILAGLGVDLGLLPERGRDLVLAGAIISILVNPMVFAAVDRLVPRRDGVPERAGAPGSSGAAAGGAVWRDHLILVGYGGVGRSVARGLRERGEPFVVIEDADTLVESAQADGMPLVVGHAATPEILAAAAVPVARKLLIAIPNVFESGQIVEQARAASPSLVIVARADSAAEAEHLAGLGADVIVERRAEIARGLLAHAGAEGPPRDAAVRA
ncbi:MAG TPA: YbaL family putative K(+) efflux transporter [Pseudomonadales bacterium]|nr:YbaL family putative K(+) efflux transporter [Pseudomonadales bacterium]